VIDEMLVVLRKEAIDAWRDRRSIVSASMYALWAPVALAIALTALARDRAADQPLDLAVAGGARAASLMNYLRQQLDVRLVGRDDDVLMAVRSRQVEVAIAIADDYPTRFAASQPAAIEMFYDGARSGSLARAERVRRMIDGYSQQIADSRLLVRGVVPDTASPIELKDRDVSTAAGRAGRLLGMLPIFLLVAAFTGGMNIAVDATAGERERRSLEALLVHPVATGSVVLGKWVAAAVGSAISVVLMLAVTSSVLALPQVRAIDVPIGLSFDEAVVAAIVLMPLAFLAPALQMLVSVFATSYKEAQTHVSLLLLVPTVPGFLVSFGSLTDSVLLRLTPIVSQQYVLADLLGGAMPTPIAVAGAAAATLVAAGLALAITSLLLSRERLFSGIAR
jgi:sodium transport system permease protein